MSYARCRSLRVHLRKTFMNWREQCVMLLLRSDLKVSRLWSEAPKEEKSGSRK